MHGTCRPLGLSFPKMPQWPSSYPACPSCNVAVVGLHLGWGSSSPPPWTWVNLCNCFKQKSSTCVTLVAGTKRIFNFVCLFLHSSGYFFLWKFLLCCEKPRLHEEAVCRHYLKDSATSEETGASQHHFCEWKRLQVILTAGCWAMLIFSGLLLNCRFVSKWTVTIAVSF